MAGSKRVKVRASFIWIVGLFLFAMPLAARAQVTISLPMAGYYRPGRYMPLHVVSNNTKNAAATFLAMSTVWVATGTMK